MSFNQVFRLDAITEVSRESASLASISQTASSDADTSQCSTTAGVTSTAPTASLLGPVVADDDSQFLNVTNNSLFQGVTGSGEDDDGDIEAANGSTLQDTTMETTSAVITVDKQDEEAPPNATDDDDDGEEEGEVESVCPSEPRVSVVIPEVPVVVPSINAATNKTGDEKAVADDLVQVHLDEENNNHMVTASPMKKDHVQQIETTRQLPETPSPIKKTGTTSPTATEPLSPENKMGEYEDDDENNDKSGPAGRITSRRYIWIVSILLVLGALVGIVVALRGGNDDNDASEEASASRVSPTTATTTTVATAPFVPNQNGESTTVTVSAITTTFAETTTTMATSSRLPTESSPVSTDSTTVSVTTTATTTLQDTTVPATTAATTTQQTTTITPPTAPPSVAPTPSPFLAELSDLTPEATLLDPNTVQGQALQWLWQDSLDNPTLFLDDVDSLRQRYAVTVLDRTTNGGTPRVSTLGVDTCEWEGIACVNRTVTSLNWANTGLTGTLADEMAALTDLQTLDLAENFLQGGLPDGLFECTALEYLYLHQNELTGPLSEDFAKLPNLLRIYLGDNRFTGPLPQGFGSPNPFSGRDVRPLRKNEFKHNVLLGCSKLTIICFLLLQNCRLSERSQQRLDGPHSSVLESAFSVLLGSLAQSSHGFIACRLGRTSIWHEPHQACHDRPQPIEWHCSSKLHNHGQRSNGTISPKRQ